MQTFENLTQVFFDKENGATGGIVSDTVTKKTEILEEKYSIFGLNLDDNQKKIVDTFDKTDGLRQQMIDAGLKYNNEIPGRETIEITLDGEKIVFDKVQPITQKVFWKDGLEKVEKLGKEAIGKELAKKIVKVFKGKQEILGIPAEVEGFWTRTIDENYPDKFSYYASFRYGNVANAQNGLNPLDFLEYEKHIICRN